MLESFSIQQRHEIKEYVTTQIREWYEQQQLPETPREIYGGNLHSANHTEQMLIPVMDIMDFYSLTSELGAVLEVLDGLRITLGRFKESLELSCSSNEGGNLGRPVPAD